MLKAGPKGRIGIVVGGGPAPGINGVISAVTIEAINSGFEVYGFYDGFAHLSEGVRNFNNLKIESVSRIQNTGGSILRTSRVNPTKNPAHLENVVRTLVGLNVTHLVTIGGDDTAFSASKVSEFAKEKMGLSLHVAHVPKTIDNDLPLPQGIPTFGYQTAREIGTELIRNLMEDAKTSSRWFLAVMMGRTAGHLALGAGKSAGATITIIPEEFQEKVRINHIADILAGSIIKRLSFDRRYGVAVLAEGLLEKLAAEDLEIIEGIERDAHGHIRLAEVNFSDIIKKAVKRVLEEFGISLTLVDKEIGYELRCAPPVAFDVEYTRNLGYAAVDFLLRGGNRALISIQNNKIVPIPFEKIRDPETGRTKVRHVDTNALQYRIARKYMIRLEPSDFADEFALERLATAAGVLPETFRNRFQYLADPAFAIQSRDDESAEALYDFLDGEPLF
ncbi:MAG: 6-phosphofructokinase [Candidatus Hydrogenedentota bacterium]|nr:MAG: 6-phosphofructokinase [Candidatus Hydrogenedentota bacterium]